ncbi:aspartate kinase [Dokdonia sinensis]|uniref:Aspartokinase n=1 Tax=Dokdonia sinensis TaxID=2479847 RepID=A0A3M0H1F2_9FLAO|nr:aspartate kinase [Dokdonia sinensis]RMB63436.1 aspartate kinase [Dokdonia sinensis]
MQIFKFGGASVKDAEGVKNVLQVLLTTGTTEKLVVISAMGKTTNAMEDVIHAYFGDKTTVPAQIHKSITYHQEILDGLFPKGHAVYDRVKELFGELKGFLAWNKSPKYDFVYDQVVSYGELISTTMVSTYLNENGLQNNWIDARDLIQTDDSYRDARVDWDATQKAIKEKVNLKALSITQGFIGSDSNNFTTTLGREGSDYSGGIFAYCLNAESLTIWKDVPGVLNGDPRVFENTELLHQISYEEAIELAFYGASVIHPKTLQPLQRKEIPLFVKSFINPTERGTAVSKGQTLVPHVPCYIVKKGQVLISLSSLDFSFMMEDNIGEVFKLLAKYKMKVDLIQNSAISFSVCVDNKFKHLDELVNHLKGKFKVQTIEGVSLYTIRHFTPKVLDIFQKNRTVLLKQVAQNTVQLVTQN